LLQNVKMITQVSFISKRDIPLYLYKTLMHVIP
jgi:hypothetical protein